MWVTIFGCFTKEANKFEKFENMSIEFKVFNTALNSAPVNRLKNNLKTRSVYNSFDVMVHKIAHTSNFKWYGIKWVLFKSRTHESYDRKLDFFYETHKGALTEKTVLKERFQ